MLYIFSYTASQQLKLDLLAEVAALGVKEEAPCSPQPGTSNVSPMDSPVVNRYGTEASAAEVYHGAYNVNLDNAGEFTQRYVK